MVLEYFEGIMQWIFLLVQTYGPLSVFVAVIIEEVFVPIPSPLVIMGASFILIPAGISIGEALTQIFFLIVIPASIASTIGSFFVYFIGYYGGKATVTRFEKFLGFGWKDVEKTEKRFKDTRKTWITITVLRAIPFFPIALVSLTSGVLRLNKWKYALSTLIGSIPRTFILAFMGWSLGSTYTSFATQLNILENIIAVSIIICVAYVLYAFRHKYMHHFRRNH